MATVPVLQPTLNDDAHSRIHFTNWKKSLASASQSLCRTIDECGAYSLVSNDQEWQMHPLNKVNGQIRPRPSITKPIIYRATEKSTAVINLFNHAQLQWKEWTAASMLLHQAMINSVGPLNLNTIDRLSGHAGIISLTCQQLVEHITNIFGTLHPNDVFYLEASIKEELSSFADFRDFVSRNSLNYDILEKIPHTIGNITKIQWLENSLQRFPQFDIPIGTWKSVNTTVSTRTYEDLITYLTAQYTSLPANTPTRGGSAFDIHPRQNNGNEKGKGRGRRRGRGNKGNGPGRDPKRQRTDDHQARAAADPAPDANTFKSWPVRAPITAPDPEHRTGWEDHSSSSTQSAMAGRLHQWSASPATTASDGDPPIRTPQQKTSAHRFYCALHGFNITHNGVNCTHMLRDPTTYSERHLNAKQPSDCANPAGNDHIQYIRPPPRLH
jgi:hypothetical protein